MAKQEVKLLGLCASLFSVRVEWGLRLKCIDYIYIEEDIYNKSALFLELNPVTKKVLVLIHNQKPLAESLIILEYHDDQRKECPLSPQEPCERASARFWAHFAETKILEAAFKILWSKGEDKELAVKEGIEGLEKLKAHLKGKKYFVGQGMGYLDVALGWISVWLPIWEDVASVQLLDPTKFPAISAWTKECCNHPVIKSKTPPKIRCMHILLSDAKHFLPFSTKNEIMNNNKDSRIYIHEFRCVKSLRKRTI